MLTAKDTNNKGKMSTFAVCFNRICEMDFLPKGWIG